MEAVSVLVWNLPIMLSDVVSLLFRDEKGFVAVVSRGTADEWIQASEECNAQVVITAFEGAEEPEGATQLLRRRPQLKIFGLHGDASQAFLFELAPRKLRLGKISPERLITVIRAVVSPTRGFDALGAAAEEDIH